jgi:hypothetical protein
MPSWSKIDMLVAARTPDDVGARIGFLGHDLRGDDACGVLHPGDLDVGVRLVEALGVGLQLILLEGGIHGELRLLRERGSGKHRGCERNSQSEGNLHLRSAPCCVGVAPRRRWGGPAGGQLRLRAKFRCYALFARRGNEAAALAMRQLQIVDNLHAATSNRNMLKTGNGQSSAASPGTASPPHTITVLQTNSLPAWCSARSSA